MPTAGGSAIPIVKNYMVPRGPSWGADNNIVFATNDTAAGLLRVPAFGGEPAVLTKPDAASGEKNHWRPSIRNGRELFYIDLAKTRSRRCLTDLSGTFATGNPAKLFETASAASLTSPRNYDVAPDNQRFLMIKANTAADRNLTPAAMIVVQNWFTELNAKLPAPT